MMNKSDSRYATSDLVITRLITNRIGPPYSYYHSLNRDFLPTILFLVLILYPHPIYKKALSILVPKHSLCALRPVDIFTPRGVLVFVVNGHEIQRVNGRLLLQILLDIEYLTPYKI